MSDPDFIDRLLSDLDGLDAEIARDESRIAAKRRLRDELRATVDRYKAVMIAPSTVPASSPKPHGNGEDEINLFGRPIPDAARVVLSEIADWGDYAEVARIALSRGYRSHKSGGDPEKVTRSFYETMRRDPSIFEQHSNEKRRFRLRTGHHTGLNARPVREIPKKSSPVIDTEKYRDVDFSSLGRQDEGVKFIAEREGGRIRINDIIAAYRAAGYKNEVDDPHLYNALHSALRRSSLFQRTGEGMWELVRDGE